MGRDKFVQKELLFGAGLFVFDAFPVSFWGGVGDDLARTQQDLRLILAVNLMNASHPTHPFLA